jgi:membrane associated rhomboid family serine protease
VIPLKANVPTWRLAYATVAVAVACAVAFAVLLDRAALLWPVVFLAGNMVAIWTFGSGVEPLIGHLRTLALLAGVAGLAVAVNALAGAPAPAWAVVSAAPALAGLVTLFVLRPRVRVISFSAVPFFMGVIEVPLAVIALGWLGIEALAVALW